MTKKTLQEAVKSLDTMSADEFDALIDSVLNDVDKVQKVTYSSDLEARVQEIQADARNIIKNRELDQEDELNIGKDRQALRARDREKSKYSRNSFKNMEAFKFNFYNAIKDQVEEYEEEEDTWSVINRRHEDDPTIILPGQRMENQGEDIPSIEVFFDQSGSWSESDIQIGQAAVSCINEFDRRGEIKLNIYYFSNHVHTDAESARDEGGTTAWLEMLDQIAANKTKNVVIITDSDMQSLGEQGPSLTIEGCVWFIWKNGSNAQSLPAHLKGRRGNFQYAFNSR